jgi:excisionase family DNA binding protein
VQSEEADGETPNLMTTREVADYLRIKERRVYELVRQRAIPCTRVTGKWLFPKTLIDLWLARNLEAQEALPPPAVIAGSQDPLLDWAVKESDCGLALLPGGSLDGLRRLAEGEAVAAGLHLLDPDSGDYNEPALRRGLGGHGLVLIEWARRQQGLVVAAGNPHGIAELADLRRGELRLVRRQAEAGSQLLFAHLLELAGIAESELAATSETARGEIDLGLAILEDRADVGLAVEAVARSLRLDFLPLADERYDLAMRRRDYFEPPLQRLLAFARSPAFAARAAAMGGYDITGLGEVRFNGA